MMNTTIHHLPLLFSTFTLRMPRLLGKCPKALRRRVSCCMPPSACCMSLVWLFAAGSAQPSGLVSSRGTLPTRPAAGWVAAHVGRWLANSWFLLRPDRSCDIQQNERLVLSHQAIRNVLIALPMFYPNPNELLIHLNGPQKSTFLVMNGLGYRVVPFSTGNLGGCSRKVWLLC